MVCAAAAQRKAERVGVFRANVAEGILCTTEEDTRRPEQYDSLDQTAQLAYCEFEERGRVDGHDLDDWLNMLGLAVLRGEPLRAPDIRENVTCEYVCALDLYGAGLSPRTAPTVWSRSSRVNGFTRNGSSDVGAVKVNPEIEMTFSVGRCARSC